MATATLSSGRKVRCAVEPPAGRVSRAELVALLTGARKVLPDNRSPIGGAYRLDLARRIDAALARERAVRG